jgi:TRAP-type C4-dicarboxylate transport system permease small subunit
VIAFFCLLAWMGWSILEVLATDRLVSLPEVPVSWAQSVIPLSAVLIVVAELLNLPAIFAEARSGAAPHAASGEATH